MGYISDALNRLSGGDDHNDRAKPGDQGKRPQQAPQPAPHVTGSSQGRNEGFADEDVSPAVSAAAAAGFGQIELDQDSNESEPLKFDAPPNVSGVDTASVWFDDRLVALTEPGSVMAEEYRSIRTSMLAKWEHRRHLVHTITSATPQEGKTITTLNLGISFAELRNRRIAVLEADLRLPLFDKMIGLPRSPGLVGLLEGKATLTESIHRLMNDRLHVIPAGRRVGNMHAVQLLSGSTMASLIESLRKSYDHVIIDTPPVIELADAGILGTLSDEVLLIARMHRTPKPLVEQAIRTLTSYNTMVGGLIATDQKRARRRYYYYKYGYKQGYGYHQYAHADKDKKAA